MIKNGKEQALCEKRIRSWIMDSLQKQVQFQIYQSIDSTNTKLKEQAADGEKQWTVVLAEEQTRGKGRMNRSFYSPDGTGIYMSILLRPELLPKDIGLITVLAAAAVTEAIKNVYYLDTEIKWVNDVYYQGKKICGILAESVFCPKQERLEYVVLGIGINVGTPREGFPKELQKTAASLETFLKNEVVTGDNRNRLIAEVLNFVYKYYNMESEKEFLDIYRKRSFLIGRQVYVVGNEVEILNVTGISDKGELIVEDDKGAVRYLSSGEVSVREQYESNKKTRGTFDTGI